jgi:hypothetical protein
VEFEPVAGGEAAHDGDHLVHARAAPLPGLPAQRVVFGPRAGADAEPEPPTGEHGHRGDRLGDQHRGADGQLEHEGGEAQPLGDRAHGRDERERLQERLLVEERTIAFRGVGILGVGDLGVADAVGDRERVKTGVLGGLRQREVEAGIDHGIGEGEAHASS